MVNKDTELYPHEQYKFGSKEKEEDEFRKHAKQVIQAQTTLARKHSKGNPRPVFHAKIHGCLAGRLILRKDRPEVTRYGIFSSGEKNGYNAIARFSNGVGLDQHDLKPDVRGLALKIFGVGDNSTSINGQTSQTIDWLMTNSTNPFGRDQEEFVQFMEANVHPGLLKRNFLGFLLFHPKLAKFLLKATVRIISSLVTEQYWSGHPYLLGPQQAMKFNVRPSPEMRRKPGGSKFNSNYLGIDLHNRIKEGPIKFILSVQLEKDNLSTPIEDSLIEWTENESPSIPVAELELDRLIESKICENLRFTPGHYIPDHRPLGNLGRGRIFTYKASQIGRHADEEEPREQMIFHR